MPTIQIGTFKLTGAAATVVLLLFLCGIVLLVVRHPPSWHSWPTMAAVALWVAFTVYWGRAARNSAPDQSMESVKSRQTHQLLLYGGLILVFFRIPGLGWRLLPSAPYLAPLGLGVETLGALLAVWSRRHLGRNWSGRVSIKVDHQLIRSGPYRLLRHPIYTGLLLMYIGPALMYGELHGLLGVIMVVYAYCRKIGIEETALSSAFPDSYPAYRRKTWALLPGIY